MFTEIDRDYHEGDWPQSRETVVVRIQGLRENPAKTAHQ